MNAPRTIDTHTHILAEETIGLLSKEAPKLAPRLTDIDGENSVLEVAGVPYRPFPRGGWDIERRLADMDAAEVDVHVLSATPQTYYYDQEAGAAAALAAIQNEEIAKHVATQPDRFLGIATLPMQAPEQAAAELRRAVRELGLRGAMIGSNCEGKNLDDPSFEPLWAAAAELDAFLFIHPVGVAGMDRMKAYYLRNLIGNPLDTTIAAACLVFGGVLERHPGLTVCLAHGGGFVPYQMGRWVHGHAVRPEPKAKLKGSPQASIDRLLFDTILHAKPQLESMIGWVGASRVLLGSDYPYDMAMLDCVRHVRALGIAEADRATILGSGAEKLLAKPARHSVRSAAAE
jgi:aminocarboxymuconate-semialdehyde decarboxylase